VNNLSTTTIETFITGQVTDMGEIAGAVIGATVLLGLGIYLVFWGINKIKGGLG